MKGKAVVAIVRTRVHHATFGERMAATAVLAVVSYSVWYVTRDEAWYKAFEFSAVPFIDKLLFGLGE